MKQSKYIALNKAIHQALIKELSYLEENIFQRFIPYLKLLKKTGVFEGKLRMSFI